MKANKEQVQKIAEAFRSAVIDNLKEMAMKTGGELSFGTDVLKAAAFPAFGEACGSEFDAEGQPIELSPVQCAVIWEGVMKSNESALRQHLERLSKAGTLGFKLKSATRNIKGLAMEYAEG